jgi:Tol biopolymer transport system component/DNA-binding winged helix-turn-helix (wHTH) protein
VAIKRRWDDFVLDLDGYRLERNGVPLSLEPKAFNLLVLMVARPGHLFTKQEIFDAIWPDTAVTDHALTRVVAQLRRVLKDEAREARYIETVPTRGYRWLPTLQPIDGPAHPIDPQPAAVIESMPSTPASRPNHVAGLAATLVLATLVIGMLAWMQASTPVTAEPTHLTTPPARSDVRWPVQLTTHQGLDLHPAMSPAGDALAYVSDRGGTLEIYVRALGGASSDTALTSDGANNVQPAWSPDGRTIAYHSARKGGIWLLSSRGGLARQVAATGSNPAWSADGRRIAFQSDEHNDITPSAFGAQSGSTIWMVDADGSSLRQLTRSGQPVGGHAAPAWSGDGRFVAFTVFEAGSNNGVWLADLNTLESRPLELGPGLFEVAFAPDGSAIYVAGGEAAIVRLPFDASSGTLRGPRELIPIPGVPGVRGLSVSSDGTGLVFAGLSLSSHIWAQPIDRDGTASGPARAMTNDTSRRNSIPAASPDGSKVAYTSTRAGELSNVWVMDADGGNAMQITSDEAGDFKPTWFPDGKRIAYLSSRGNTSGIWAVDIATRRDERLFDLGTVAHAASGTMRLRGRLAELELSPSLTRVAFSLITPPNGHRGLFVTDLATFAPRAMTEPAVSAGYPAWSPNEQRVAVEIKDGSSTHAAVIDVETGRLQQLTNEPGQTWVRSWSPDGRKVAVAALRNGTWSLRWIDVASGRQRVITPPAPPHIYMRYPEWSPRGDLVFFERGELRGNLWRLALP